MTLFILPGKGEWAIEDEMHLKVGEHIIFAFHNKPWRIIGKDFTGDQTPIYFVKEVPNGPI
jgi:hypothetical protein